METLVQEKVTLKTTDLQDLVSKATKACSMVEMLPLTMFLSIQCKDNVLKVTSTDDVNILQLTKSGVEGELDIVVNAKLFSSLISKLTTPLTEIINDGNKVVVKANGSYELELIKEGDKVVKFKQFEFNQDVQENFVSLADLHVILSMNKSCKAEMKEMPSLFNYYTDDQRVLTSDLYRVCLSPIKMFNSPVCIPPTLMELVPLITDETGVYVKQNESSVLFYSQNGCLYGKKAAQEDLENFPVKDLLETFNDEMQYSCLINRTLLINALDRMSLFTSSFESNCISLKFTHDTVNLFTKTSDSNENIRFIQPSNFDGEFTIILDGTFFKNQLSAFAKEDLVLKFGNAVGIQLVCDNVVQTLSSLDEE